MLGAGALRPKPPGHDLINVGSFLTARCGNLRTAFAALDDSSIGHLTGENFARGMGRLGFKEDAGRIYRALDTGNTGIVTMKQFLAALEPESQRGREDMNMNEMSFLVTAEHALEIATKANQSCTRLESKVSKIMADILTLRDEVHAIRYEGSSQAGDKLGILSAAPASDSTPDVRKEIVAIHQDMSSRVSTTDHKVTELTKLMREVASEVAILQGRLEAIGERPDLAAQIVASGPLTDKTWQNKEERRVLRSPTRTPRSSDSDISALRPRSVSAERPHSTARQFTVDATQLLRSVERTTAYPDSGLAPVLDVIAEARPSMERPSTQAPTSARPSMETTEQERLYHG